MMPLAVTLYHGARSRREPLACQHSIRESRRGSCAKHLSTKWLSNIATAIARRRHQHVLHPQNKHGHTPGGPAASTASTCTTATPPGNRCPSRAARGCATAMRATSRSAIRRDSASSSACLRRCRPSASPSSGCAPTPRPSSSRSLPRPQPRRPHRHWRALRTFILFGFLPGALDGAFSPLTAPRSLSPRKGRPGSRARRCSG